MPSRLVGFSELTAIQGGDSEGGRNHICISISALILVSLRLRSFSMRDLS